MLIIEKTLSDFLILNINAMKIKKKTDQSDAENNS